MNLSISRLFHVSIFSILASLLGAASVAQVREDESGGDVRVTGERSEWRIVVRSADPTTLRLLQTAFGVHGAYEIVPSMQQASFGIKVDPMGGAGARLTITSGSPEQTLHSETFAAETVRAATFKAIDRAIYKTSGRNGFFSGKLAFVSEDSGNSEIYVADMLFGGAARLTSDGVDAVRPHWSPDGSRIAYTGYKSGFPDIYELNLRSNTRSVIAAFKGTNVGARYSPDGSRIAMIITGGGNADVWVKDASGAFTNLTKSDGLESAPCWSPDGTRLVYAWDRHGGNQLFVMPSTGGAARRLATNQSGYCAEPDWNPVETSKILFTAAQGSGFQIAVFDTQAGSSAWVTREPGDAIEGQWLSDGRHIIYTHRRANSRQIKILDTKTRQSATLSGSMNASQASFVLPR